MKTVSCYLTPFSLWVVYTNPSVTSILGYELGYHTTTEFLQLATYPPCGLIWINPPEFDNLYVVCGEPIPISGPTVLLRMEYMALGFEDPGSCFLCDQGQWIHPTRGQSPRHPGGRVVFGGPGPGPGLYNPVLRRPHRGMGLGLDKKPLPLDLHLWEDIVLKLA